MVQKGQHFHSAEARPRPQAEQNNTRPPWLVVVLLLLVVVVVVAGSPYAAARVSVIGASPRATACCLRGAVETS